MAVPARAHLGHLGELAGHGHWVGAGALVGAAAIAALLADRKRKQRIKEEKAKDVEGTAEEGAEPEAA